MRKLKILFMLVLTFTVLTSCERVEPNYQGVLMQNYGKNGKSDFALQKGRVWTMSPGVELFQVPLWEQRAIFEGSVNLKASNNTEFTSKPRYSYKVIESRAIDVVFANKHLGAGNDFMKSLEDNILEAKVEDILKDQARQYHTDSLMSDGGQLRFENVVEKIVEQAFLDKGLELLTFNSQLEFSSKVKAKIDTRNEVNTNISVIDQQIDEQRKLNELENLKTEFKLIQSRGLTDEILRHEFIRKWDGKTPLYGDSPIFYKKTQ